MTRYENIPYRRWMRKSKSAPLMLTETAIYRRLMVRVGQAIKSGMAVNMDHAIVGSEPMHGRTYDTVSFTLEA